MKTGIVTQGARGTQKMRKRRTGKEEQPNSRVHHRGIENTEGTASLTTNYRHACQAEGMDTKMKTEIHHRPAKPKAWGTKCTEGMGVQHPMFNIRYSIFNFQVGGGEGDGMKPQKHQNIGLTPLRTSESDMNPRPLLIDWTLAKPAGWRNER